MINPERLVYDGWVDLVGVNGSKRPTSIAQNEVHRAINTTFRDDQAQPRPGFVYRQLVFRDDVDRDAFNAGRWQGCRTYHPDPGQGKEFHIVSKGGKLWKIDPFGGYQVTDISIQKNHFVATGFLAPAVGSHVNVILDSVEYLSPGQTVRINGAAYLIEFVDAVTPAVNVKNLNDTPTTAHSVGESFTYFDLNPGRLFKAWMEQAEKWMIIQDGESRAVIFDGISSRRAEGFEVPVGTVMSYGRGRLWVATPDQKGFIAGDLIYGSSGTVPYGYRDSVLMFTENSYISNGGTFRVPDNYGLITAMEFMPQLDVSLGQGPLIVFTDLGSFTVRVPDNRDQWDLFSYNAGSDQIDPIQTVGLRDLGGATSDNCVSVINSDFFFRSLDGVRTYQLSRRQFGSWANTPISKKVEWAIGSDPQALLKYASATYFQKRYLLACSPQVEDRGVAHKGIVALDLDQVDWTASEPPQWEGLWTFSYIYQILSDIMDGESRCFVYGPNVNGDTELYELDPTAWEDRSSATESTKIRWMIETSGISFPSETNSGRFDLKSLWGGEMQAEAMQDQVWFKVRWRPDGYPCWLTWAWWKECCPIGWDCGVQALHECREWTPGLPQIRPDMGLPQPPDYCNSTTGRPLRNFYSIQCRIDIRGYAKLKGFRLVAKQIDQPTIANKVECIEFEV